MIYLCPLMPFWSDPPSRLNAWLNSSNMLATPTVVKMNLLGLPEAQNLHFVWNHQGCFAICAPG